MGVVEVLDPSGHVARTGEPHEFFGGCGDEGFWKDRVDDVCPLWPSPRS